MRLSHKLLPVCLAGLLPAAALLTGAGATAASASTHPASAAAQRTALTAEITRELNHPVMQQAGVYALGRVKSTNWSGYADTGTGYTKMSASWTEPSATCGSGTSLAVFWVGIDGFSSRTVEQDGTGVQCVNGRATYFTWWEMYPKFPVQVVSTALRPGDKISALVRHSGTRYTLTVTDHTRRSASFTKVETCSASTCKDSGAEWIAEAPAGSAGIYPLSNFHRWAEASASITKGSRTGTISSFPDDQITMVDGSGKVKSQPSGLSNRGKNFTCTWKRSS